MSSTRTFSPPVAAGTEVGASYSNANSNANLNSNSNSRSQPNLYSHPHPHSHSHSQSHSRSRAQRPIHFEIDEGEIGGGGESQRIRPTASLPLPLPLPFTRPLPPLIGSSSRRRTRRSSSPTITTQQPRPSLTPPLPQNINQTPPAVRLANSSSANLDLPHINHWESGPLGFYPGGDLENSLLPSGLDDTFLIDLASTDFSSPSTYPSFTGFDLRPNQTQGVSQSQNQSQNPYSALQAPTSPESSRESLNAATSAPRRLSTNCIPDIFGPERSTTQLSSTTNTTGESQSTLPIFDTLDDNDFLFDSPASSFSEAMPPATRRTTTTAARAGPGHTSKRRRTSVTAANTVSSRSPSRQKKTPAPSKDMEIEELFGPSPTRTLVDLEAKEEEIDTVDLTETNEVPEDLKTPEKDNRIKLAAFQCVICMDDCVNLTVTHCGT
ncbi:e3 ubiquitin ligase complex slx8-rfp subunit slx8 [Fusarium heterosporum]|uniref:E3 ubiquitin ligase complex slx8-rfp subunit slx8 n=1 Tax=Fusarium heterosporum TaxID=42747 RepID=A0A8H5U4W7_FUSHE|nr:e3 ubiquitin ligase complex slx8-rfp subunit slx8 [Fusarium heterosporum]